MQGESIKNMIWHYRHIKKLRQADLAFILGHKDASQISCYERGLVMPDFEQLWKISQVLDVGPEALFPAQVEQWSQELIEHYRQLAETKENIHG